MSGRTAVLTMGTAVAADATVTLTYIPSLTSTPIRDLAGNEAGGLSNRAVANATAGVLLSAASLTLAEGGSGSYTVRLAARPSADVTVAITSDNAEVTVDDTDGMTAGTQNTLAFTTMNWAAARTVTVRAAEDTDAANDSATLTHAVSGAAEYAGLADLTLGVTVNDNDGDQRRAGVRLRHGGAELRGEHRGGHRHRRRAGGDRRRCRRHPDLHARRDRRGLVRHRRRHRPAPHEVRRHLRLRDQEPLHGDGDRGRRRRRLRHGHGDRSRSPT